MKFKVGDKIILNKEKFELHEKFKKEINLGYKGIKGDFSIREIREVDAEREIYKVKGHCSVTELDFRYSDSFCIATPKEVKEAQIKNIFKFKKRQKPND
jgi:hypothetical protein